MADDTITLTEAARRLGVHYMTAYRYVRTGKLPAYKEGSTWRVQPADVEAMRARAAGDDRVGGPGSRGPGAGRRRRDYHVHLEDRLLAGDERGAWAIVEGALTAGADPEEVYLEILAPAMAEIGEKWATGQISIDGEHRASVIVFRMIGRLGPQFARRGRTRGTVVLGAPEGDRHAIPVAMAADLLRGEGFAVVDLGADTPAMSFVDAGRAADRLVGVGISATRTGNAGNITHAVEAIHQHLDSPVVVGGQALLAPAAPGAYGADHVTTDAHQLIAVFTALAEEPRPRPPRPPDPPGTPDR